MSKNQQNSPYEDGIIKGMNKHDQSAVNITARDRVMQAWEDTMEHARDFKKFSEIYAGTPVGGIFKQAAEQQGVCAARFHDILVEDQQNRN